MRIINPTLRGRDDVVMKGVRNNGMRCNYVGLRGEIMSKILDQKNCFLEP
jgi:hypothetical protein